MRRRKRKQCDNIDEFSLSNLKRLKTEQSDNQYENVPALSISQLANDSMIWASSGDTPSPLLSSNDKPSTKQLSSPKKSKPPKRILGFEDLFDSTQDFLELMECDPVFPATTETNPILSTTSPPPQRANSYQQMFAETVPKLTRTQSEPVLRRSVTKIMDNAREEVCKPTRGHSASTLTRSTSSISSNCQSAPPRSMGDDVIPRQLIFYTHPHSTRVGFSAKSTNYNVFCFG